MSEPMVKQEVLDAALRIGSQSVDQANHYIRINGVAINAIADALELIKTGRTMHARTRLEKTLQILTRLSTGGYNRKA